MTIETWPGRPYPLGANWDGRGVNFALFSANATGVELCLFDSPAARTETDRVALTELTDQVWHAYLPGVQPGQLYGYRVAGPYEPSQGHRFNANKVLIDPYAKAIGRDVSWDNSVFGYLIGDANVDLSFDNSDSAAFAPLSAVIDPAFSWNGDRQLQTRWEDTVVYELHVKGFTQQHPDVPPELRGTYAGLASPAAIDHLHRLGVTAVELLPVQYHLNDQFLLDRGLTNYWGYNTLGYFAPQPSLASTGDPHRALDEFKTMVRELHAAGIEVLIDVVYNHTAEGNQQGPTLGFRGVDNASYYHLADDQRYYMDWSGCGNALNMASAETVRMITDSLRYWVLEMHVDGFRFDLASVLARQLRDVDKLSSFFAIIHQDPVLSQVKLVAEPWDVGDGGYQVGNFPVLWSEWNGRYRDCVRKFWKGEGGEISELASRLSGSSDLYNHDGRAPFASINFITCHDGFTLTDLVSYNDKHNEANGEDNRDGSNDNNSWNCGVEGATDDSSILALRDQQRRNFFVTLLLSQGVPMLRAGDELGQTQNGNNNCYCQDNDFSWLQWDAKQTAGDMSEFLHQLIELRRTEPVFRRQKFFQGRPVRGPEVKDIYWVTPDGNEMTDADWSSGFAQSLGLGLVGSEIDEVDAHGQPLTGNTYFMLFNAWWEPVNFAIPTREGIAHWEPIIDTSTWPTIPQRPDFQSPYHVAGRSIVVLRAVLNSSAQT